MSQPVLVDPPTGLRVLASAPDAAPDVLTEGALAFLSDLVARFRPSLQGLLRQRIDAQRRFDRGALPDFRDDTRAIREGKWCCGPLPISLYDRRVEITGPVDRKMVINALNSGAQVFMADFEDATSPTWENVIEGQQNLMDALRRRIERTLLPIAQLSRFVEIDELSQRASPLSFRIQDH